MQYERTKFYDTKKIEDSLLNKSEAYHSVGPMYSQINNDPNSENFCACRYIPGIYFASTANFKRSGSVNPTFHLSLISCQVAQNILVKINGS